MSETSETEQAVTLEPCDYRKPGCAAYGQTIDKRWVCNNHICEQLRRCWLSSRASVAPQGDDEPDNLRLAPMGHALSSITSPMGQTPEVVAVWNEFWKLNAQLNKREAALVTAPVSTGRRFKPMCDDPECSVCNHMAKLHAASMEDEFNKEPATTLTTPLNRVRAKAIVGTVFDNTAASHETLKRTMIQRIENYFNIRSAATSTTPDGEREGKKNAGSR